MVGNYCIFFCKIFNVLCFVVEEIFGDKQWKIGIYMFGFFEYLVEFVFYIFLNCEVGGFNYYVVFYFRVVSQACLFYNIKVLLRVVVFLLSNCFSYKIVLLFVVLIGFNCLYIVFLFCKSLF